MNHRVTFAGCGDAFGSGGRFNTCFLVDAPRSRIAIDFGASSLIALKALNIDHNSIDTIICTHIHGDHCGGIPFLLMDAMLGAKRISPLTIVGPIGITRGIYAMRDSLFPGMEKMTPKFDLKFIEVETLQRRQIGDVCLQTFPAVHTAETNPTSVRVEIEGKVVAYTGDGEWTPHMIPLACDADLLIAECYFYKKEVKLHLNYPTLRLNLDQLSAKKIILTHMSPEMLEQIDSVPELCARDGLVVEI